MPFAIRSLFGGLRQGRPGLAGVGAAVSLIGLLRRRRRPDKELLFATNLDEGEGLRIRFRRGAVVSDETEIED